MGSEKLLPCPFDERPAFLEKVDGVRWRVCCSYCAVKRGMHLEQIDAIAAWNTRAPADLRSALEAETIERCAKHAECAFDDRPRSRVRHPSQMDWEDGYRDGTRAAAKAIRALAPTKGDAS